MTKTLQTYIQLGTVGFIIKLALIAFLIKIPAGILGYYLIDYLNINSPLISASLQEPSLTLGDVFFAILLAPVFETLVSQMIPIETAMRFTHKKQFLIITSALLFMVLHFPVIEFFPSAFAVGYILAWAWIEKRKLGILRAFVIVTLIHSLHNALAAISAALFV